MATVSTNDSSVLVTPTQAPVAPIAPAVKRRQTTPGMGVQALTAGSAACFADLITFPLDVVKVRQQVQSQIHSKIVDGRVQVRRSGIVRTLCAIARKEGFSALYGGLTPGLQRQMTMSAIRIGFYEKVRNGYMNLFGVQPGLGWSMLGVRVLAGVTTGSLAILVAQPMDVVKIRMQAAGSGINQYNGVFDAYYKIAKTEGISNGLYRGLGPNMVRNGIVNVFETAVYDLVKESLISKELMEDTILCHFSSAFVAGTTATLVASPVDVIKTRYMNSSKGEYRSVLHCAALTAKKEGPMAFYKGFRASCMRIVSWNIVLWMSYEQLKRRVNNFYKE